MKSIIYTFFIVGFLFQPVEALSRGSVIWGVSLAGEVHATSYALLKKREALGDRIWSYVGTIGGQQAIKVAAGPTLNLWALTDDGVPFFRRGITANNLIGTGWAQAGTLRLKDIAVGENSVWGVTFQGSLVTRIGITSNDKYGSGWKKVLDKEIEGVAVSPSDKVWYVSSQGDAYEKSDSTWVRRAVNIEAIAPGRGGIVWALGKDHKTFFSKGFSLLDKKQRAWTCVTTKSKAESLSVASDFQVSMIDDKGNAFLRFGATSLFPQGSAWEQLPGKLQSITCSCFPGVQPGGDCYTHCYDKDEVFSDAAFHYVWQLKQAGRGKIQFKVRPETEWLVYLREHLDADGGYKISSTGSEVRLEYAGISTPVSQSIVSLPGGSAEWDTYVISLDERKTSLSRDGRVVLSFKDKEFRPVKYVGFGGGQGQNHEFSGITIDSHSGTSHVIVPAQGFKLIAGKASRIAVGCRGDKTLIFSIGEDRKLYRYDSAKNIWLRFTDERQDGLRIVDFKDVSISSDGILAALSFRGEPLYFQWKSNTWDHIRCKRNNTKYYFDRIAVGNKYCLWGLNKSSRDLYQWTPDGWKVRRMGSMSIDVSADGAVVSVDADKKAYLFNHQDQEWDLLPNKGGIGRIFVGSYKNMWGTSFVANRFYLWHLGNKNSDWSLERGDKEKIATGFKQLSVNSVGTVFALDIHGHIYRTDLQPIRQKMIKKDVLHYINLFRRRSS